MGLVWYGGLEDHWEFLRYSIGPTCEFMALNNVKLSISNKISWVDLIRHIGMMIRDVECRYSLRHINAPSRIGEHCVSCIDYTSIISTRPSDTYVCKHTIHSLEFDNGLTPVQCQTFFNHW